MPGIMGLFSKFVSNMTAPLSAIDPEAPTTLNGKPVIAAEYVYKSNPHGLMQQRYFVLLRNKLRYYKTTEVKKLDTMQPNGEIKFKDVIGFDIKPCGSCFKSELILDCGDRKYTLCKTGKDTFLNLRKSTILQNTITAWQDYKKYKKPKEEWVTEGSGKGLRFGEPTNDKRPLFECEPILSQQQINLVPCSRVFTICRASNSKGDIFGVVFSNTGLALINPETGKLLTHSMDVKFEDKDIGFHDRIGDVDNITIRFNKYCVIGLGMFSGIVPDMDVEEEVKARKILAESYQPELAKMYPMHFLTQSQNIYDRLDDEGDSRFSRDSDDFYAIASATRGKQLIDTLLPLKYGADGEIVIPTIEIPPVSRELLGYRPLPFDKRIDIPEVDKSLIDNDVSECFGQMAANVKVIRTALDETQRFVSGLLDAEKDLRAEDYPTLDKTECANIINSIMLSRGIKKYKDIFKTSSEYWIGRKLNAEIIKHLNAFRRLYAEYEDIYKTFYAIVGQLQYHYEAVIINVWFSTFFRGYYTLAQQCFDLPYKANEEAGKVSLLIRKHTQSLRFLIEAVVRQYNEMNFKKNVERFLPLSRDSDHLFMYELDTEFKMLEYEFVPELQAFRAITSAGEPVTKDTIYMNHGYSVCRTYNSTSGSIVLAGINNTLELVHLCYDRNTSDAGRYATFKYSREGSQHKFLCTFMTDNNRTTIGGTWVYDESSDEMVWNGPKFNTPNCYKRFHVDPGIPANVALFMATRTVIGKAEYVGSSSIAEAVSQAYMRMLLNHIYLDNDAKLQADFGRTSGCYRYPEIVPFVPLITHRIDLEYSKTKAIEWKETVNLKKIKAKQDKLESAKREKLAEMNKLKQETIQNLQRIDKYVEEGNELKKKAKGRAAEILRSFLIKKSNTRDISPEIVNAETNEEKIYENHGLSEADLNYVANLYDHIKNTYDSYNTLPALMPEPKPEDQE